MRGASIRIGQRDVWPAAGLIDAGGDAIRIKPRNMDVLMYLADRQGTVVSSGELLDAIWRAPMSDHAVHKAIADLRKALADDARNPSYIRTVPRRGYCLIADVRGATDNGSSVAVEEPSLAVLPFADVGPGGNYLGEGIAEAVSEMLARVEGIRVASPAVTRRFTSQEVEPDAAGRVLRVANVLCGRVLKTEHEILVSVWLHRTDDSALLWSCDFQGVPSDVFTFQDDIAIGIANALKIELTPTDPARSMDLGTDNVRAYEAYLLGRHEHAKHTVRSIRNAIAYLETAIELDPDFARAYGRLFECHWHLIMNSRVPDGGQLVPIAERYLDQAVARGYEHPSPPVFLKEAMHPERTPTPRHNAERALKQILRCDSEWKHYEYHLLSNCLCEVGLFEAAAEYEERYNELTRYQHGERPYRDTCLSELWGATGRFDAIIELWTRAIELHDEPSSRAARSAAFSRTSRHDLAATDLEAIARVWPHSYAQFYDLYWRRDLDAAEHAYARLVTRENLDPKIRFWSQFLMGDVEGGLDTLVDFVRDSNGVPRIRAVLRWMLPPDIVETVENHPRFMRIAVDRGLTDDWRAELIVRVNEAVPITGILVQV